MEPELDNDGILFLESPHENTGDLYYDIFWGWHSRFKIPVSSASWAIVVLLRPCPMEGCFPKRPWQSRTNRQPLVPKDLKCSLEKLGVSKQSQPFGLIHNWYSIKHSTYIVLYNVWIVNFTPNKNPPAGPRYSTQTVHTIKTHQFLAQLSDVLVEYQRSEVKAWRIHKELQCHWTNMTNLLQETTRRPVGRSQRKRVKYSSRRLRT